MKQTFLENLMPSLRRKLIARRDPCPDADTLTAVVDGTAADSLKQVVAGHLKRCPACDGLHSRLVGFERGGRPVQPAEWMDTQRRSDDWLDNFLASPAAARPPPQLASGSQFLALGETEVALDCRLSCGSVAGCHGLLGQEGTSSPS